MSTAPSSDGSPPPAPPPSASVPDSPERAWHQPAARVREALDVSEEGLTTKEVVRRREQYGPNKLQETKTRGIWEILLDQVKSLVVLLLFAAAAVSLFFGDLPEAIAIGVVLGLNTAIGFFMEWRAVRSMEALRKLSSVPAVVRREGKTQRIPAEELVPGDLVLLEEGDIVTADLRLCATSKLQADESALTGESVPVDKSVDPVPADAPLAERSSMVYKGTAVTRGSGEGLVVESGMSTELGEISSLVEESESEATPLEERLDALARSLVGVVLLLGAGVAGSGILAGRELQLMIETGIALAVAAIPEGLPIVATIALARGLGRMARRNALVRRLSSVETLGSTSVICTDKTGTLTENRMTVQELMLPLGRVEVHRDDSAPPFTRDGASISPDATSLLHRALEVAVLCNATSLDEASPDPSAPVVGDPMETALLRMGRLAGLRQSDLRNEMPEVERDAFDRETKMMATVHASNNRYLVAVKGAPEAVLESCTQEAGEGETRPLDAERRQYWLDRNETMAANGLRVIALATKMMDAPAEEPYTDLQFLGLVGLLDPPRSDVRASIDRCNTAGVEVVMVTGDQPATALEVARAVGLAESDDVPVISGRDFVRPDEASREERDRLLDAHIFARVTPRQKLDLIDLHQDHGRIVAMTGDGVNDAPALKSADIGIAMGQRGTQVAQEAADMVLQDDAFSTIVAAVEEGRTIFKNIQNFVYYLMSCNVGEVMVVGLASLVGVMLPLLPLQILFLNLVTDVFPALALGVGESETEVMKEPPRRAEAPIVGRRHWFGIALYGLAFTAAVLGALFVARSRWGLPPDQAVTISFLTLALAQLWHVFNMRDPKAHPLRNTVTTNPYVWGAVVLCIGLLVLALYVPFLADALSIRPPNTAEWGLILGASLLPLAVGQLALVLLPDRT